MQALRDEPVGSEAARVHACRMAQRIESDSKNWISRKSGLPIQVDGSGSSMRVKSTSRVGYSRYDDASIRVDAPN